MQRVPVYFSVFQILLSPHVIISYYCLVFFNPHKQPLKETTVILFSVKRNLGYIVRNDLSINSISIWIRGKMGIHGKMVCLLFWSYNIYIIYSVQYYIELMSFLFLWEVIVEKALTCIYYGWSNIDYPSPSNPQRVSSKLWDLVSFRSLHLATFTNCFVMLIYDSLDFW